jgi:hypothetical protein
MKTHSILLILALSTFACTKITDEKSPSQETKDVKLSIDYAFPSSSGSITTKGGSVYLDFYTKYIDGKVLTPRTYNLLFEGINNHLETAASGKWGDKDLISLPPDRYAVQGNSYPTKYDLCGDTCYIEFHDTIDITQSSSAVVLKAHYACSLILLDTTNVLSTKFEGVMTGWTYKPTMLKTEAFYSSFVMTNSVTERNAQLDLVVNKRNNKSVVLLLWAYKWELGKYYYFSNTDNNYNLSPMING